MKNIYREACEDFLRNRIDTMKRDVQAIRNDLESETKSSAGDKYETSREMMKQEENKIAASIGMLSDQLKVIQSLPSDSNDKIGLGSVIRTDKGDFYISVALGKLKGASGDFFAISVEAPIYTSFVGKMKGDVAEFNTNRFEILEVL